MHHGSVLAPSSMLELTHLSAWSLLIRDRMSLTLFNVSTNCSFVLLNTLDKIVFLFMWLEVLLHINGAVSHAHIMTCFRPTHLLRNLWDIIDLTLMPILVHDRLVRSLSASLSVTLFRCKVRVVAVLRLVMIARAVWALLLVVVGYFGHYGAWVEGWSIDRILIMVLLKIYHCVWNIDDTVHIRSRICRKIHQFSILACPTCELFGGLLQWVLINPVTHYFCLFANEISSLNFRIDVFPGLESAGWLWRNYSFGQFID